MIISLAATVFALYFWYRITERLWDATAARATTLVFAFFPTAFFLNAVYTEPLFVAFAAGSCWAAYVRRDLLLAGLLGAFAAATRNTGVLLLIPLGYEWARNRQEFGWRGVGELALVPVGLLGCMAFLQGRYGDPTMFADAQTLYWERELANPLETLATAWTEVGEGMRYVLDPAPDPALAASGVVNFAFLALALVLLGLSRFILGAFPLFLVLGYLLSRNRPALYLWLVASSVLGVGLTAMFVTWRWVA